MLGSRRVRVRHDLSLLTVVCDTDGGRLLLDMRRRERGKRRLAVLPDVRVNYNKARK